MKPMIVTASDEALASMTSLSVIAPTPRWSDLELDLLRDVELEQRVLQGLHRTGDVALEDEVERGLLALLDLLHERLQGGPATGVGEATPPAAVPAAARRSAGPCGRPPAARNVSPAPGTAVRPSTSTGRAGPASVTWLPFSSSIARTRPCAPPATIESPARRVPFCTSTVATAPRPLSRCASIATPCAGPSIGAVSSSDASAVSRTASSSSLDADAGLGRHVDEHRVAAVLLGDQAVLGQLLADLVRVGLRLVDLVDRDHDRHVGRLGVVQRLDRLRHDTVVGRDHQDHDVGDLGTTGTHGGERLVTRGVDEGDRPVLARRAATWTW